MIGIVVVSHSPALADAAVELALQMVPGERPAIAIAAGAADGVIGTDATRVAAAIEEVASPDGVLVFLDLGSALMSTELALEFISDPGLEVRLTSAPFVEGLIAGIVTAAGGATLDAVEREARGALDAKRAGLGESVGESSDNESSDHAGAGATGAGGADAAGPASADSIAGDLAGDAADTGAAAVESSSPTPPTVGTIPVPAPGGTDAEATVVVELINPAGLHARPAALIAAAAFALEAAIRVENLRTGASSVRADSSIALMTLGARLGDSLRVSASGPGAQKAVADIAALVKTGFGEL